MPIQLLLEYGGIASASLLLIVFAYPAMASYWRIKRWHHALAIQSHLPVFNNLYHDINGYQLSRQARATHDGLEFIYGEIEFLSFIALLSLTKPDKNTLFYDLGSGTGKAVLACAMVYSVHKAVGIEYFPALHHCAQKQAQQLAQQPAYAQQSKAIEFIRNDFFNEPLIHATLIFINATTLFGNTWERLVAHLESQAKQATIITTSKALHSPYFKISHQTQVSMSWGIVWAYIHIPVATLTKQLENIE